MSVCVRGASVPPDDKIWIRHRSELDTLQRLGECDVLLVGGAKELGDLVAVLPVEAVIDPTTQRQIDQQLDRLMTALSRRGEVLAALL